MTSAADRTGTLGGVSIRLAPDILPEERYQRRYVPVDPKSQEIPGTGGDKIAPESTIATWHIDDWSAGEGDARWRQGSKRYNQSIGIQVASDGSGLVRAFEGSTTQLESAGGDFSHGVRVVRGADRILTAEAYNGDLYEWDSTNEEWDQLWDIGGATAAEITAIAAINDTTVFVASGTTIRKVTILGDAEHYAIWAPNPRLVSYQHRLYGLAFNSLYDIDTSTADARTEKKSVGDASSHIDDMTSQIATSDVGPIWLAPMSNGVTYIYEYNVASDTGYIVGELPKDVVAYSIMFYSGIYFVGFRYAASHAERGDPYLYYKNGGQQGVLGPIPPGGSTLSRTVELAGVIGDRIYVAYASDVWGYDLTSGGITTVGFGTGHARGSSLTVGKDVFLADIAGLGEVVRLDTTAYKPNAVAMLETGCYDFGYLGIAKTLLNVSIVCEAALATGATVGFDYAVDGASYVTPSGTISAGETTKTWTISTNASTVRGVNFELRLWETPGSAGETPKIVSVTAEATGSEDRLEWVLLLDLSDNNIQQGQATLDGLKTLKANHNVEEFVDPWTVLGHTAAELFDVTVEDVILPHSLPGGTPTATVLLRSAGTV